MNIVTNVLLIIKASVCSFVHFPILKPPRVKCVEFTVVNISLLWIAVHGCTCTVVAAAVKQSAIFPEFRTCSSSNEHIFSPRRYVYGECGKETQVICLVRSQRTTRIILKLIFQGKTITYICFNVNKCMLSNGIFNMEPFHWTWGSLDG